MKFLAIVALVCFGVAQCQPTTTGECTKGNVEEIQKCIEKVEASPEVQSLRTQSENAIKTCMPNYPRHSGVITIFSNCTAKETIFDACIKQVQLEAAGDRSLSAEERRKAMALVPDCLAEDAWKMIENKARHLNGTDIAGQLDGMEMPDTPAATQNPCVPDKQASKCITKELLKSASINMVQNGFKSIKEMTKCYESAPAPCHDLGKVDCHAADMAALVEKYRTKVHDCVKTKGY